jgi:hypothetical protein
VWVRRAQAALMDDDAGQALSEGAGWSLSRALATAAAL